jgi:hypothetical protein
VSAVYAWLSRHPQLVDGLLALLLAALGAGSAFGHGRPVLVALPLLLAMVVPVAFRRRNPEAAFGVAVVAGAIQLASSSGPSGADLAIPVLLYTLAAYRPRRYRWPGWGFAWPARSSGCWPGRTALTCTGRSP